MMSSSLFSQRLDEKLLEEVKKLNEIYKDDKIVLLESNSDYSFSVDKKSGLLNASHAEASKFLSLKSNSSFVKRIYTSDNSYIENYSLKNGDGKKLSHDKFCGHYKSEGIFYSDAQVCAYHFSFSLPGAVAAFEAKTVYTDTKYLTYVFFHDEIPAVKRTITFTIPNTVEVELVERNFQGFDIKKEIKKGEATTYTYTLENIKPFPEEENAPGYLHFLPHILILTKSYQANGQKIKVLSSTDDLYTWYHSLTNQINHDQESLLGKVAEITNGLETDKEKIEAIYYWVQDNIKYIAFENGLAGFKPENASQVYYKRYGDCKGMANLVKEMLLIAGYDARLTWIGTNQIPYTYDIPTLAVDNHMICTVFANGEQLILDPTEKFNLLGQQAERIQGKQILIENGASYIIDTVKTEAIELYLKENKWLFTVEEGRLKGNGTTNLNGEYKKLLLNYLTTFTSEQKDKFLTAVVSGSDNPDNFLVTDYSELSRKNPLKIDYKINLNHNVQTFDREMYVKLDFDEEFKGQELKVERTIPYYFGRKKFNRTLAEVSIPQGYSLSYLPPPFHFKNEYFSFEMKYEKKKNKITYSKEIKIFKNTLPVSEFTEWNNTIGEINKFYNDQIILITNE